MPPEVISFITNYGYLSIFIIVFSQEMGIPNPIPNELILLFCGYLSTKGILHLPILIIVAVLADSVGTSILYFIFYFFGKKILKNKPRWFPLSTDAINRLSVRLAKGKPWKIYLCRLAPFLRGYTSIITGLLQMKPKLFLPIAFLSALTWSSFYLITGRLLGPYWNIAGNKLGQMKYPILITALILLIIIPLIRYYKNNPHKTPESN